MDPHPSGRTPLALSHMATLVGRRGPKSILYLLNQASAAENDAVLKSVYFLTIASQVLLTGDFPDALDRSKLKTPCRPGNYNQKSPLWNGPPALVQERPDIPPLVLPRPDVSCAFFENWNRLGGDWKRLYSSDENGFSFRTMQEALLNFQGPTVMFIETTSNDVLGFGTDCPWKSSRKWFWSRVGFLFIHIVSITPILSSYGTRQSVSVFAIAIHAAPTKT